VDFGVEAGVLWHKDGAGVKRIGRRLVEQRELSLFRICVANADDFGYGCGARWGEEACESRDLWRTAGDRDGSSWDLGLHGRDSRIDWDCGSDRRGLVSGSSGDDFDKSGDLLFQAGKPSGETFGMSGRCNRRTCGR
jgi:hypothetical protein